MKCYCTCSVLQYSILTVSTRSQAIKGGWGALWNCSQVGWQANQSLKTVSIRVNRRIGANNDWGAVDKASDFGRIQRCLKSVIASGPHQYSCWRSYSAVPESMWTQAGASALHRRGNANAQSSRNSRRARRERLKIRSLRALFRESGLILKF